MPSQEELERTEGSFTEEERTVEREWHIFLRATVPAELSHRYDVTETQGWTETLGEMDLIPETIQLKQVSFYFNGTYQEAYLEAQDKCNELNNRNDLDQSEWSFESGSIMATGE